MTPAELLAEAVRLAGPAGAELGTTGSRASALLARSALEEAVWGAYPSLRGVPGRSMLLILPRLLDARTARSACLAWGRLSAASHHHAYDLPPTAAELDSLLRSVEGILATIERRRAERAAKAAG